MSGGVLPADPFEALDAEGVGELVAMAVERGRCVCGEMMWGIGAG